MTTRTDPARQAVLEALADAIDRFYHREKDHRKHGRLVDAEGCHQYLVWVQRAYKAEFHNYAPRKPG